MSYVGKITTEEISNALVASTLYSTCDTAMDVAAKVVQCPEFDRLMTGVTIHIKFTHRNTASNPTLNINGLGAKNIFRISSPITGQDNTKSWHNGSVVSFTYDGNQWIMNDYTEASDGKVMHSPYTGDYDYRILLGDDDDLLDYGIVGKSRYATFNPSKKAFTFGSRNSDSSSTVGDYSVAEGYSVTARGKYSHVEGNGSVSGGICSHAEGNTAANGDYSHSEGYGATASGISSHAEGYSTANGIYSHAEGYGTSAQRKSQHVFGEFNELDTEGANTTKRGKYIEIVGKGDSSARSDARRLDWNGNEWLAGALTATDVIKTTKWDGTNTSLQTVISNIMTNLTTTTKLVEISSPATTATTVNLNSGCKFSDYAFLFITAGYYGNFQETLILSSNSFKYTNSGYKVIMTVRVGGTDVDFCMYYKSDTSFYAYATGSYASNIKATIYGLVKL